MIFHTWYKCWQNNVRVNTFKTHLHTIQKMFKISQKPVDATGQMKILTEVHSLLLQTMAGILFCFASDSSACVINFTQT